MPVILSPNEYDVWLDQNTDDPEMLDYLLEPCPDSELIAYLRDYADGWEAQER